VVWCCGPWCLHGWSCGVALWCSGWVRAWGISKAAPHPQSKHAPLPTPYSTFPSTSKSRCSPWGPSRGAAPSGFKKRTSSLNRYGTWHGFCHHLEGSVFFILWLGDGLTTYLPIRESRSETPLEFRCGHCCGRFRCGRCWIHMTLMSLPRHLPGRRRTLCAGLKTKMDRLLDDGMGKGMWLFLLLVPPN